MEEKKHILEYLEQIFISYGITMLLLNIFVCWFGEEAQAISSIFTLGNQGITKETSWRFFAVIVCIVIVRWLFLSDHIIKHMRSSFRIGAMLITTIGICSIFIILFDWFPTKNVTAWAMFFFSFALLFTGGTFVTYQKMKIENKRMETALKKLKAQKHENDN